MRRPWVEAARHGDHAAFEELAARLLDRSYATAVQILRDRVAAEDAVQEALIRAWRDLPALHEPDRFDAWFRRILVRACFDEAASSRRRHDVEVATDLLAHTSGLDPAVEVAGRDAVERVLAELNPMHRATLVLRHVLDLSVPMVAEALGVPLGTAKSRLHHAERALRRVLDRLETPESKRGGSAEGQM